MKVVPHCVLISCISCKSGPNFPVGFLEDFWIRNEEHDQFLFEDVFFLSCGLGSILGDPNSSSSTQYSPRKSQSFSGAHPQLTSTNHIEPSGSSFGFFVRRITRIQKQTLSKKKGTQTTAWFQQRTLYANSCSLWAIREICVPTPKRMYKNPQQRM